MNSTITPNTWLSLVQTQFYRAPTLKGMLVIGGALIPLFRCNTNLLLMQQFSCPCPSTDILFIGLGSWLLLSLETTIRIPLSFFLSCSFQIVFALLVQFEHLSFPIYSVFHSCFNGLLYSHTAQLASVSDLMIAVEFSATLRAWPSLPCFLDIFVFPVILRHVF